MAYILAHDLGTTGNKATVYAEDGSLIASAFAPYPTDYPAVNWAEQCSEDWWQAVCASTAQLMTAADVSKTAVKAVSFSGQMMGCLPLDRQGRPLRSAIIWADQRSLAQAKRLEERVGADEVYTISGHRLSPAYSAEKIMWVKDHQPDVYARTHKFLHAKDYIVCRLTGEFVSDYSDASGMNLLDIHQREWSPRLLAACELDVEKLPKLYGSCSVVGEITENAARDVGLAPRTPVVIGGGDGVCAGIGAGVVRPGKAYAYIGSSAWVALFSNRPIPDQQQTNFTWIHMDPDMYMPCGTMQSAGASYSWFRDTIGTSEAQAAVELGCDVYELLNLLAEKAPPGARHLLYLPYLMGERSPYWNPAAKGAFVGLTVTHGRAHMVRSVLEGVAFNLKLIIDCFEHELAFPELRVIGGGAKGRVWRQIMADVFGKTVLLPKYVSEATSLGAAIAGGVGVGLFADLTIAEELNPIVERTEPIREHVSTYRQLYPLFKQTYASLEDVFQGLRALE